MRKKIFIMQHTSTGKYEFAQNRNDVRRLESKGFEIVDEVGVMLGFPNIFYQISKVNLGGGAKYGQIVLLMGGAGSGKSTATRRFVNTRGYKVINPNDIKELIVRAADRGVPEFAEMKGDDPFSREGSQIVHRYLIKRQNLVKSEWT